MTDHNARQAGLTDEQIADAIPKSSKIMATDAGKAVLMRLDDLREFTDSILTAKSADARNGEGVALTDALADAMYDAGRRYYRRELVVWKQEARDFLSAHAAPAPIDATTIPGYVTPAQASETAEAHAKIGKPMDPCDCSACVKMRGHLYGDAPAPSYQRCKVGSVCTNCTCVAPDEAVNSQAPAPAAQAEKKVWRPYDTEREKVAWENYFAAHRATQFFEGEWKKAAEANHRKREQLRLLQGQYDAIKAQQSATPAEPFAAPAAPAPNAEAQLDRLERVMDGYEDHPGICAPADAASEADKRHAYAAGLQRAETICREQKYMALQPMRTFSAEDVLQANRLTAKHLADLIQHERQQGADRG